MKIPEYRCNTGRQNGIPVARVIDTLDRLLSRNDKKGAERHLKYWREEAVRLGDKRGELSVVDEMLGFFRRTGDKESALEAVRAALTLTEETGIEGGLSAATIRLNAATTLKAFGKTEEALPLYEAALKVYTDALDENDPIFAGFWNNYALALSDTGRKEEAEEAYFNAIFIMKNTENGFPNAAISYLNLATLYESMEDRDENDIYTCLNEAVLLFKYPKTERDEKYFDALSKCISSFRSYGLNEDAAGFEAELKEFYERT